MDYQRSEYRVGIVVLISLVVGIGFIFSITNIGKLFHKEHVYKIRFEYLDGLKESAEVYYTGFKVGMVGKISLSQGREGGALVWVDVDESVVLRADDHASIASQGLLGVKLVDIVAGPPDAPVLGANDVLVGEKAPSLKEILMTANKIADNVNRAVTVIGDFFSGTKLDYSIQSALKKISATLDEIKAASSNISAISESGREKLDNLFDKADRVMTTVDGMFVRNQPKIDRTIDDVSRMSHYLADRMDKLSEHLGQVVKRLNDLSANKDKDISETIDNLKKTSENLKAFSREIEGAPWKLLRK
jgi:phospholipid/cholesterol/gamma-HCH transport system substrate-binding protein